MSSMSNYEVRPAKLSDAKAIAEIHASSSRAAFKALFPGEQSPAVPADMGLAYWRDAIEFSEAQGFVAIDAGGGVHPRAK